MVLAGKLFYRRRALRAKWGTSNCLVMFGCGYGYELASSEEACGFYNVAKSCIYSTPLRDLYLARTGIDRVDK